MLVADLAQYLHNAELVTFDEAGISGDCFVYVQPSDPDECVTISTTGGGEPDSRNGYDQVNVNLIIRGTADPRPAEARAAAIYGELHGLADVTMPGGTYLVSCIAMQPGPVPIGRDENGRHEFSLNFEVEIRNLTTHRE